jgi:outer membrane protein assembly factor BamB
VTSVGEVRCVDLDTGVTRWSFAEEIGVRSLKSAVVIDGDQVIVSLTSGAVVALNADSGAVVWKTKLEGELNTTTVVIGEELYVGDVEGRIHRVSPTDGKQLGTIEGKSPVYGSLLHAGDCLLALRGEDTLSCLDPKSGVARWHQKTDTLWSSFQPLILDDVVIVGTDAGDLHAFRLEDGATAWTRQLEGEIKGLGTHAGVLYVGTVQGRVYALPL